MNAFEELYKLYYSQVYFYVLGLCRNEHIAEEITQETFFKALKKMDTFKGECKINVWIIQKKNICYYVLQNPIAMIEYIWVFGILLELVGIVVTVISIIVTLISIRQTGRNKRHQKSNRADQS